MIIRRSMWLMRGCMLLATLLAACASQTAPTEPAEVPKSVVGMCEGIQIVFFAGGYPACPFGSIVHNGAVTAAADLGADVDCTFSDWDPEKLVRQFREAIAANPDGIAVMGLPEDDAIEALIDEARAKGIIVTSQTMALSAAEEKYREAGFGYVGPESYESGYALAQEAIERSQLGAGDRAMVWGSLSSPSFGPRTQGVLDGLEEAGMTVDYIEIDAATDADYAAGTPVFTEYVASHPDVKLVCTDHEGLTGTLGTYLQAAGKGPDDIFATGFNLTPATVEGIREGWVDLVLDQQPFLQGYLPILQICLTEKYQFAGLHIDTGGGFVHRENVEALAPLVVQQIR
jgi:simple sugar transport system substrate-binding protein